MTITPLALVTGSSRGLGRSTAIALARDGVDVVITYLSGADAAADVAAEVSAAGARAVALTLDVSSPESIADFVTELPAVLVDNFGRDTLDYLVNNAGNTIPTTLADTSAESIDALYAVLFRGPYLLTQGLVPLLTDGGAVINLSSGLARFVVPGNSVYGAMKAAVDQVTAYWAKELGPRQIRVNSLAPGPVATEFAGGRNRDNEAIRGFLSAQTAMGRVGEPDDIGPLIASLLTGPSAWVTGQRIEASGGIFL